MRIRQCLLHVRNATKIEGLSLGERIRSGKIDGGSASTLSSSIT
jgi:hypothetical protein